MVIKAEMNNLPKTRKRKLETQISDEISKRKIVESIIPELVKEQSILESEVNVLKGVNEWIQKAIGSNTVRSN